MDVLLERKVDVAARVADLRDALDGAHDLAGHAIAQPLLDVGVTEMKEVPAVIPHEAVALDGAAIAARLRFALEDDQALTGMQLAPPVREPEARHPGADHDDVRAIVVTLALRAH